ncbi:energy-coupling factor transport system ATP-binding protein [Bifidobacterium commune]|nr:energy-coupling factor transporter ATPase [Bifidobacterium commune]MBB2954709.1 energy-coupling factor transport system ATP-binding protein [Bifidobacterium commune]
MNSNINVYAARLQDVRFSYDQGHSWVLDGVDLDIRQGERLCLIGLNGSGKSTLAGLISGLSAPDAGTVELLGTRVFDNNGAHADNYRTAREGIGALFQNPADQIITTKVGEDVAFGPENLAFDADDIDRHVYSALDAVEMLEQIDQNPTYMSGGQQQRVTIAGTIAMSTRMIVLDEPTAMLDHQAQRDVLAVLDHLQSQGVTIVQVTHKPKELRNADRILRLKSGQLQSVDLAKAVQDLSSTSDTSDAKVADSSKIPVLGIRPLEVDPFCHIDKTKKPEEAKEPADMPRATPVHKASGQPIISLKHVSFRYPSADFDTLHDCSMSVLPGESVAIMGRNGTGKSTLTKLIAGLVKPTDGEIEVAGLDLRDLSRRDKIMLRTRVGLVMQQPEHQLFEQTVRQDVSYGPLNQGFTASEADKRASNAMKLLGITDLADRSPFSLSGGQQRLAAIAGVIACNPRILILDEPTAGLDATANECIFNLIRSLQAQGVTIIMVTHSMNQAHHIADRIISLDTEQTATEDNGQETVQANGDMDANGSNHLHIFKTSELKRTGIMTRLDPRVKLVVFLMLTLMMFLVNQPAELLLAAVGTFLITAFSGLKAVELFRSLRGFLILFFVIGIFNMFFVNTGPTLLTLWGLKVTRDGLGLAALYTSRFSLAVLLGIVLLKTTTPTALTDAFASLASPLRRFGLHTQEMALVMSLALRFLPTLANETRSITQAQAARGGSIETGSPMRRLKALAATLIPVFAAALRHSDNLSLALDARCYEEGIHRTHWHAMHVTGKDLIAVALSAAYLTLLLTLKIGLIPMPSL